ncbi:MAG: DUF3047 domain-containing protein [Lentisphaerae bacterium]|nr:DUF3047 domain-containing protein [Lentisphaerota bacterium]
MIAWLMPLLVSAAYGQENVWLRETFENLDRWKSLSFPKIEKHSTYTVRKEGTNHLLVASSRASASGIMLTNAFDVQRFPMVTWRWKTDRVYEQADFRAKEGDDYPIRLYVMFLYDPARAALATRVKYALAKAVYGEYPPLGALNYVWAGSGEKGKAYPSPYTDQSVMVPLQAGPERVGEWVDEAVNVVEDYRRFFGGEPPRLAALAIMNDSDNTGGASTSYVAHIEIRKPGRNHDKQ